MKYATSWWEWTGKMTPFIDAVSSPILRSRDTGEEVSMRDLPVGSLYSTPRDNINCKGPNDWPPAGADGLSIVCKLPDGQHWYIDSRASNCDKRGDAGHRCWIRHGTVGDKLTVDKAGNTCGAGAGSISTSNYHGFLRDGELVS